MFCCIEKHLLSYILRRFLCLYHIPRFFQHKPMIPFKNAEKDCASSSVSKSAKHGASKSKIIPPLFVLRGIVS